MASLVGAVTALALYGAPGQPQLPDPTTFPRPGGLEFTHLGLGGTPGSTYGTFTKTAVTYLELDVTDSASLSASESPIDSQQIVSYDIARIALAETAALLNRYSLTDTAAISLSEVVALSIAGVLDKPVTDTASLSLTESTALSVTVAVTDTASVSVTDDGEVAATVEGIAPTDTASLSVTETSLLEVFVGQLSLTVSDTARLTLTESAAAVPIARVTGISIQSVLPEIRIRRL
jgi:hypothetical protein